MPEKNLTVRHIQKNDTLENWETKNPVLLQGEIGFATDENIMKVGNGSTHWNDLPEVGGKGSEEDNVTITKNASDKIQAIGTFNKNTASGATGALYDWVGTLQEWKDQNIATLHPDWVWYITDDVSGGASVYTKTEVDDKFMATNRITNCITHIPQDIKLELNNGTLTLKAGSKVYVPNGAGVFDVVNITSDVSTSLSANEDCDIFLRPNNNVLTRYATSANISGTTTPTGNATFYNTSTNTIHRYNSGVAEQLSFPIARVSHDSNGVMKSIDQVFDGFGYIGSTVFALPGVKGLIPDGRNADGSLKSNVLNCTSVQLCTLTNETINNYPYWITSTGSNGGINLDIQYNAELNKVIYIVDGTKRLYVDVGFISANNGKITSFTPKTAFHALDYNDSEYIAHQAMPSNKYIDLTLGASGTTYTAPADGYVCVGGYNNSGPTGSITVQNVSASTLRMMGNGGDGDWGCCAFIPLKKGDTFKISYVNISVWLIKRFIYAEGAQ